MSDRPFIIIGDKNEFLIRSISSEIFRRGKSSEFCDPTIDDVCKADPNARVYLLHIESTDKLRDLLVFLKDAAFDRKMSIAMVGERLEIQEAEKIIKKENVGRLFARPINAKEITDGLLELDREAEARNSKKRILIIDDDPEFLRRTEHILRAHYKVYIAGSGASGLMLLSKHKVDLILLDYTMPVLDGMKVLEVLKAEQETADIPVLFMSARTDADTVSRGLLLGAENFVSKQTAAKELAAVISDFFTKKEWEKTKQKI